MPTLRVGVNERCLIFIIVASSCGHLSNKLNAYHLAFIRGKIHNLVNSGVANYFIVCLFVCSWIVSPSFIHVISDCGEFYI